MEDRSEKLRKLRFSERWTKKALNMEYLPPPKGIWVATGGMKYGAKIGRAQNFVSQLRVESCDCACGKLENCLAFSALPFANSAVSFLALSSVRNAASCR